MTRPDELLAGRELDSEIAARVFGYQVWQGVTGILAAFPPRDKNKPWIEVPAYSTSIEAAWQVVEKVRGSGIFISVAPLTGGGWWIGVEGPGVSFEWERYFDGAPEGICRAALAALEQGAEAPVP